MDLEFLTRVKSEIDDFFLVFDRQEFFQHIPDGAGLTFFQKVGLYPSQIVSIWDSVIIYRDPGSFYPDEYMFVIPYYKKGYQIEILSQFFEAFLISEYEECCTNYFSSLDDNYWNIQILVKPIQKNVSRR